MITGKVGSYAVGDWLTRLPHWIVVRACPAVLLFGGMLHATPISSVQNNEPQKLPMAVGQASPQTPGKAAADLTPASTAALSQHSAPVYTSQGESDGICAFSSDCYPKLKVPEPQSLVLVGSGLLSMAGLIRRRLMR